MTHIRTDNGAVIVKLQDELAKANAEITRLRDACKKADVSLAWSLAGDPLQSLMLEARKLIRQALAQGEQNDT
jgi:hypothetical protein